ncbi:hypothetical protein [Corynebacterium auriscanis]|uniref:Cell wall anchor protein n=1 Tax=Corynebacterium auriscanis TaxID=99807 RepID=A0A0A2DLG1_9CORY|nr:hypothetical protein [Corynebacterium auriscanis]KGM18612.1 cell wall anchor protein [Corynebacterium auriscanis]MCX2163480.1 cell wall anchor protein [Corynebacterium auriscanis]WJY72070.1 hypothetical protein CAURIC_01970 [Corynebacterium auriscanis]
MSKFATRAFDIRNVIGGLLGLYGLILVVSYFFLDPGIDASTGQPKDEVYNLYAGIAMVVVAVVFFVWAKASPVRADQGSADATEDERTEHATR